MSNFFDLQKEIVTKLNVDGDDVREYEARLIIEEISGYSYTELLTTNVAFNHEQHLRIDKIIEARNSGEPIAYALGHSNFYGVELNVDERVLIPRSETEIVVEKAINILKEHEYKPQMAIDVGTGSGAIAIALAGKIMNLKVIAVDISKDALDLAQNNYETFERDQVTDSTVTFLQSNCFEAFDESLKANFDLIISNPPYIGEDEIDSLEKTVHEFEPHAALFADDEGYAIYETIINEAQSWLKPDGTLVLEIAPRHSEKIVEQLNRLQYNGIEILKDLSDRDRVAVARSN